MMSPKQAVLLIILVTALARVGMDSVFGLGWDEAYRVGYARIFALSYYDIPPLHVWLVGAWAKFVGSENSLLLRLPFVALFAGSTWMLFRLTAKLYDEVAGLWAAIALNLAPVFTFADGSWVLPDGTLIFFLLAGANIVARILFEAPARSNLLWIAAGVCGGLAFLSKYQAVFLFLGVLVFLLTVPSQRRWLAAPGPWLAALSGLIVFAPAILWNLQHGLIGLSFQTDRIATGGGFTLKWLPQSIGGQMLYLLPWQGVPLAYVLGRALWQGPAVQKSWFLALLAIGPVAAFTIASLWTHTLPHWSMPGWLFAFPLLGAPLASFARTRPRLLWYGTTLSAAILVAFAGAMVAQARNGWVTRASPALVKKGDPTLDLFNWGELAAALAERHLIDQQTPAVAAVHWMQAAKANYVIGQMIPVLCLGEDPQQFIYLHDSAQFIGRDIIVLGTEQFIAPRMQRLAANFERLERLQPVVLHRNGQPVVTLELFRGVGFKGR
jgi:4-amino-4-deoxy-L-arabinose transferase-like glycosyltransferase